MRHFRWLALPLLTLSLAIAGCGDDDDDDGNPAGPSGNGEEITAANVGQVQTALSTTMASAMTKAARGNGTYDGDVSGTVKVELNLGKVAAQSFSYKLTFKNYSDDGEIYLDGNINYQLSGQTVSYTGDIEFSGAYEGDVRIDITAGATGVSGTYTVNGQTINL